MAKAPIEKREGILWESNWRVHRILIELT